MDTIKTIEQLYERKELVTGVPTGFPDLDQKTAGLQPADLVIIAARPSMGKTAFALNIAQYVAMRAETAVGIFSLEMAKEQLVMRMLCAEARVDNAKVRAGYLAERDFPRLAMAAGRLAEAPIYIDDTPGQNVLELRAKARRLKRDTNLGLIIIDYLQLMRGLTAQENRVQEMTEISRSLKALAKELAIPVVALSQLNRQVELRGDKRPIMSDIRECVPGETLVTLADGRRVPIQNLVGTTPSVLAVSAEGHVLPAKSERVWRVGRRSVFTVRLASGRCVRATARHRFLGAQGWQRVENLGVGSRLALVNDDVLRTQCSNDLFWDRVVEVEPHGEEEVFDLTVPGPASWLADGIVSHNSGSIEQDADVIMFIYRDEVYHPESEEEGTAEIIIGKQRNGPIGTIRLAWRSEYTRFDSLVADTFAEPEEDLVEEG